MELALRGAVAFDESGLFGFSGEISISVFICGYRLAISPSLAFNDGVIRDVRQRVAAFEGRLEAYRQQLLAGGRRKAAIEKAAFAPEVEQSEWLHYQAGEWHLIIPPADEVWFTPDIDGGGQLQLEPDKAVPFRDYVKSIHFGESGEAEPKLTLLMPWDQLNCTEVQNQADSSIVPTPEALDDVETMMAETVVRTPTPFQGAWDPLATYQLNDWVRASDRTYWQSKVNANVGKDPLLGGESWGNRREAAIPLREYQPVSDPRVESSDREYWLDIDQVLLPEGVLPIRMKTAEQILQSGEAPQDFSSTYGRLVEYAWWSQQAIVQRRHQGADTSETEDLEHRRAVILFQLLTELRELAELTSDVDIAERAKESAWQAREITPQADGEKRLFGLVFRHAEELPPRVTVTRVDSQGKEGTDIPICLRAVEDEVDDARSKVHLLPPRQEYVVDGETGEDSRGRLRVRLPVRFDDEFLQHYLPVTSHFQVWRRVRGTAPVLVADQQVPPVTFLQQDDQDGPAIAVVDPYLATDEFPVRHDTRTILTGGISAGTTTVEYAIKLIPVGDFDPPTPPLDAVWQPTVLYLPEDDAFPVDLAMVLDVDALCRPRPSDDDSDTKSTWTEFRFASIADEQVTLALTHDWNERQGEDPNPRFEIWAEERPISDSGFYAGAAEEPVSAAGSREADIRQVSSEETLISLDDKFQVDVVPVESSPGVWSIAQNARRRFRKGFAYLFYVRPRYQSTFGEAFGRVRPMRHFLSRRLPDVEAFQTLTRVTIDFASLSDVPDVFPDALREHIQEGPQVIGTWSASVAEFVQWLGGLRIDDVKIEQTREQAINGETHGWTEPPRLRAVGRVEWIDAELAEAVRALHRLPPGSPTPQQWQVGVSASVRPFDDIDGVEEAARANQKRRIGIHWSHPGSQFGGVDLSIRDTDDSLVASSRICETSDATVFQQTIRDFSNDSAWRLTRRERAARLSLAKQPATASTSAANARQRRVNQTLYLKSENPALRELSLRTAELQQALEIARDWGPVSVAAAEWIRALNAYDRSPLNLNDPPLETLRLRARALVRYLFLGLRPPADASVDSLTREAADQIDQTLEDLLVSIDEYDPVAADFADTEDGHTEARAAFLDADFARKLAAVIRRRRIVGEDVLATVDEPLPRAAVETERRRFLAASRSRF